MTVKLRKFYEIGRKVNDDPMLVVFDNFLSDDEIEHLLAAARPKLKQALVSAAKAGVESAGRSGSNCWIPHRHNEVLAGLSERIADVVGIPLDNAESYQVIYYGKTEEYAAHFDAWDGATDRGKRCMAKGGQRLLTCLLYLNDVEEGGGTSFPKLDLETSAIKGRMLLFHNCHDGSTIRNPKSLHGGLPVLAGEKWACNLWFRENSYQTAGYPTIAKKQSVPSPKFKRKV